MTDVHSPEIRSHNMAMIKSKDTKPEVTVRKFLFSQGFRYRKNVRKMPGSPDIVLPKYKTCIFINGCFWHKHDGCKYFVWPKSNVSFWQNKIENNVIRDKKNYELLRDEGWNVIAIWECEIKHDFDTTMKELIESITANSTH